MKTSSVRTLVSELQEYYQQKVPEMIGVCEVDIKSIESQLAQLDTQKINYWHDREDLRSRLSALGSQLQHLRSKTDERYFAQRVKRLLENGGDSIRTRFLQEFFPHLAPVEHITSDHCFECGSACVMKKNIARLTCLACGQTRRIITNLTSNVYKTRYTTTNTTNNDKQTPPAPKKTGTNSLQRNEHVRIKWLHKQLQQYRIGSKKIPKEDIFAVARRLRSIHLKSVSVVKHTITRSILKALNKTDCVSQASKIADICNGTPVAAFNDAQYLNVMERLLAVQKVYMDFKTEKSEKLTRVNFPPFSFLLKQFCLLEGWHDLQECFTHSKTLEVYQTQISEWRIFLPRLKANDKVHNWDYPDQRDSLEALRLL